MSEFREAGGGRNCGGGYYHLAGRSWGFEESDCRRK